MSSCSSQTATAKKQAYPSANRFMTVESYLERAQTFSQRKDYNRAIFEVRQAIDAYPDSALCYSVLAVLYFQAKQNTAARVYAKRSLALEPTNQLAMKIQNKLMESRANHSKAKQIQTAVKENRIRSLLSKKVF